MSNGMGKNTIKALKVFLPAFVDMKVSGEEVPEKCNRCYEKSVAFPCIGCKLFGKIIVRIKNGGK